VLEHKGNIAGYLSIKNGKHIYHLFVAKDYQKQGLARRLWEHVIKTYGGRLYTVRSSLFAVPIYERLGFKKIGQPNNRNGLAFQKMECLHSGEK